MNGLPTQASSAEYQGDIEIVGGLYADSPTISDPRIRLRANFHATNSATFSRLLGRRANDQGILENVYERDEVPAKTIRGEVFVLYEGDRREIQKRPIFIDEGALTDTGTFNTFKTLDQGPDNTGMSGSFFGVSNQRFNQGVAGIVGTRFFKGTFITDNQRYHYKF